MRKSVLVLTSSFLVLCSWNLVYANENDEIEKAITTEVVATTNNQEDDSDELIFDEETALHTSEPAKEEHIDASVVQVSSVPEDPKTEKDFYRLILEQKRIKNELLRQQVSHLEVIAKNTTLMSLLETTKKKEKEEEKKAASQLKPLSDAARTMYG